MKLAEHIRGQEATCQVAVDTAVRADGVESLTNLPERLLQIRRAALSLAAMMPDRDLELLGKYFGGFAPKGSVDDANAVLNVIAVGKNSAALSELFKLRQSLRLFQFLLAAKPTVARLFGGAVCLLHPATACLVDSITDPSMQPTQST
ncbi:MAG: hypothetical protein AAB408_03500 [Patescibacteria group bacterium]